MSKIQDGKEPKARAPKAQAGEKRGQAKASAQATAPAPAKPAPAASPKGGWHTERSAEKPAAVQPKKSDGFEKRDGSSRKSAAGGKRAAAEAPKTAAAGNGAMLHARDPGVLFRQRDGSQGGDDPMDAELAEAVAEARRLLAGVAGIQQIGPGENETRQPVVLIVAQEGFTEGSLRAIPEKVHRFATLLTLPYELLPLPDDKTVSA